jgi:hypothetical protein
VNGTTGGDGLSDPTEEIRARISAGVGAAHKGKPKSAAHAAAIGAALRGRTIPEDVRAKMSAAAKVKVFTPEHRAAMGRAATGRKQSAESVERRAAKRRHSYILIAPDGTEMFVGNLKAFCTEHNLTSGNLFGVLSGRLTNHKGWRIRRPEGG